MNRLFLCSFLLMLSSRPASAILDTNNNGLSDVWERIYNNGDLFPSSFDPLGDDDSDGWTNAEEAVAGTDPESSASPDGLVRPEVAILHDVSLDLDNNGIEFYAEVATITWPVIAGKLYTLLYSPDMTEDSWIPLQQAAATSDGTRTGYFPVTTSDDKMFWSVSIEDIDSDGDGLTDAEEYKLGLDPFNAQTIAGIPDSWLATHFTTILLSGGVNAVDPNADPDVDGLTNAQESALGTNPNVSDNPGYVSETIINGDFSAHAIGTHNGLNDVNLDPGWDYWAGIPGWTACEGRNIELQTKYPIDSGNQYVELKAEPEGHYGIEQTVPTRANTTYVLQLKCRTRPDADSFEANYFDVKIDDTVVQQITPGNQWTWRYIPFTVSKGAAKISLVPVNTPNDTMGCLVDNVTLAPIEIVDKDKNPVYELKVAKMVDAGVLSDDGTLDIDCDSDRFFIRIRGAANLGTSTAKWGTIGNPDPSYNDDATEIELTPQNGDLISKSLLLVSDKCDDEVKVDDVTDNAENDRTHKIQLGGKVQISSVKFGTNVLNTDTQVPVKVAKTVKVKFVNCKCGPPGFKDFCWPVPGVNNPVNGARKVTMERFAQAGIRLDITAVGGPDIGASGTVDYPKYTGGGRIELSSEITHIVDIGPASSPDEIVVYLIEDIGTFADYIAGFATAPKCISLSQGGTYGNKIMVGWANSRVFTIAHELLHILLDAAHPSGGPIDYSVEFNDSKMLWKVPSSEVNSIDAMKRISTNQAQDLQNSTFAK